MKKIIFGLILFLISIIVVKFGSFTYSFARGVQKDSIKFQKRLTEKNQNYYFSHFIRFIPKLHWIMPIMQMI